MTIKIGRPVENIPFEYIGFKECLVVNFAAFALDDSQVEKISEAFCQSMKAGLTGKSSSLKMLPSFLPAPSGRESGEYVAVDFGGTQIRVLRVRLEEGRVSALNQSARRLPQCRAASELFDFIAGMIKEMGGRAKIRLGHTFSYPCRQSDANTAYLINWTKEISVAGVEGQNINALLYKALQAQGLGEIQPAVILNDTVGTLLTAAYRQRDADIASICGTGHNTCYLEPSAPKTGKPMIINMESGNFNQLPFNQYDQLLDQASDKPGEQRLEKMVAGRYLGELARLVVLEELTEGRLALRPEAFSVPYALSAVDLSEWLSAEGALAWLKRQNAGIAVAPCRATDFLSGLSSVVIRRAAQLVAATFLGAVRHIDPQCVKPHYIAVDGSLYEKTPEFSAEINRILAAFGRQPGQLTSGLVKDGSGIGAAIAASIIGEEELSNGTHIDASW